MSIYKIDTARKHATEFGAGRHLPEQEIKRCRLDLVKIDHFLDFISTLTYLQDTAYGTKTLKLDDGSTVTIPNAIRTVIPSRIISQYISYFNSINFEPASEMTDFYGKRDRNWHVSAIISNTGQELEVECYVLVFDSCT